MFSQEDPAAVFVDQKKDEHEKKHKHGDHPNSHWIMNMEDEEDNVITSSESSSLGEYSKTSSSSSSSSSSDNNINLVDDASSPTSNSSGTSCSGPLYDLSELMSQLPIKRGISKYFQGKSQSFTSLSSVKSIEELAKKGTDHPYRTKMKSCKRYRDENHKLYTLLPKATISKRVSRNLPSFQGGRSSFSSGKPPPIPVHKNFSSV